MSAVVDNPRKGSMELNHDNGNTILSLNENNSNIHMIMMRRKQRIAFRFLPIFGNANDIVIGSWCCVWGSLFSAFIALLPLIDHSYYHRQHNSLLFEASSTTTSSSAVLDDTTLWIVVFISSICYTIGAYLFARAFHQPPLHPICSYVQLNKDNEISSDDWLGSWCCLVGSLPSLPYCIIYLCRDPRNVVYWISLFCASGVVLASIAFVIAFTPRIASTMVNTNVIARCINNCGNGHVPELLNHLLATDWLVTCWLLFWSSILGAIVSIVLLCTSTNEGQIMLWSSSAIDCAIFVVAAAYFVAGSHELVPKKSNHSSDIVDSHLLSTASTGMNITDIYPVQNEFQSGSNNILILSQTRKDLCCPLTPRRNSETINRRPVDELSLCEIYL